MATPAISAAQAELISSLSQDDIPAKLRCAICSKLAVNAFRLPCCEQAICESCQSTLPSSCPVCEHSPLSADDCKPHKALRTTIKVFLRTEEKKREANRPKDTTPVTPAEPNAPVQPPTAAADPPATEVAEAIQPDAPASDNGEKLEDNHGASPDKPADGTDDTSKDNLADGSTEDAADMQLTIRQGNGEVTGAEGSGEGNEANVEEVTGDGNQQNSNFGPGFGFDNMNGSFPNMNFGAGGNYDQMQMMMAMQGGMPNNGFGAFPMMGMPGMGMDPMTMQNMYMNGGFGSQGMGMNGMNMNMNMGMGGFGGGANNNWNGQQSWNVGQDNFNHPNASGMGTGDYTTSFNSGFQTGFNQGNYGHTNQFNDHRRNQFGFRGRGRGRGFGGYGYSRGGYQQGYASHGNYQEQNFIGQQHLSGQHGQVAANALEGSAAENESSATNGMVNVDEFGRELRASDEKGDAEGAEQADESKPAPHDGTDTKGDHDDSTYAADQDGQSRADMQDAGSRGDADPAEHGGVLSAIGSVVSSAPAVQYQLGSGMSGAQKNTVPDVPLNAPKGPKAYLRGLPNTSYRTLQARGLVEDGGLNTNGTGLPSPGVDGARSRSSSPDHKRRSSEYRDRSKERERNRDREYHSRDHDRHERSPSRSGSQEGKDSRRRRRHRSESASNDERDDERRHRRHRRKHSYPQGGDDADLKSRPKDELQQPEDRTRSASPDESRRSSHRTSRRERDPEKRRERERDRDRDRDRDHKSSRRSHRDRDYERRDRDGGRDRDQDRERDKDKGRDRKERHHDRDRDREHRHRSSKKSSNEPPTPVESPDQDLKPPAATGTSSRGLEIKGASAKPRDSAEPGRRSSQASVRTPTGSTPADPHAAERAARDRERLLKETRRMASLAGGTGAKRSRDEGGGDESRRSSRRKGRRGEVVSVDEEEERMRRLEAERESARFRDD